MERAPQGPTAAAPRARAATVADVFAPGGPLARAVPEFEPRAGQLQMAAAVERAFAEGGVLLAEAGTGTGKTLAYLVPAILSRQRILVSTGTKTLQEQIYFKDIPALRNALGVPFTATYMKGRSNYLCLHRLDQIAGTAQTAEPGAGAGSGSATTARTRLALQGPQSHDPMSRAPHTLGHDVFLPIISDWATRTETGDRAELEDLPEDLAFWNDVSATADTCLGGECPRYDECFVTRMRQRAAASDVVIVNHHLLCADAAVRQNAYGEVIPGCSHAVLDEAHQLEDVATQYFGISVSTYRVEDLARDVERLTVEDRRTRDDLAKAVDRLRDHARAFFAALTLAHRTSDRPQPGLDPPRRANARSDSDRGGGPASLRDDRVRATRTSLALAGDAAGHLTSALDILESTLGLIRLRPDTPIPSGVASRRDQAGRRAVGLHGDSPDAGASDGADTLALAQRAGELRDEIRVLLRGDDPEYVYFVELRGRGVFLRASPIDVSRIVRELLLDRMRATVLTSATLAVDGSFAYIRARLGIGAAVELRLPSEFDFARQAILYLPPRMPEPRSPDFIMAAGREVIEILRRTDGRAFVLFTSYATLRAVQAIAEMALNYPIFVQGTAPRGQLLRQFRETPHAVLFATSSFWQGVDVIGEALSCVIIDKLPFASPADPITAARIDAIRARGGEPFDEYQVPLAVLTLQQGLGRLIRHRQDRGVLAVLDPRIRTKGYGRRFLASLPPAPVVYDVSRIEQFFRDDGPSN